jgi:hypothetical protein
MSQQNDSISPQDDSQPDTPAGVDLDAVTFDENGEVVGIDSLLADISAGVKDNGDINFCCPEC